MPIISLDGRYVLFASTANNLTLTSNSNPLPVLIPPKLNVFLRDRASNTTVLVSVNLARSGGGNGDSLPSGLSDDGRYALFESAGSDLVKGDTNGATDVFVRDLLSETTSLVSVGTNGSLANGSSRGSVMTPDGHYVAFVSDASNLVPGDTNRIGDVFVRDLQAGTTSLASVGARSTGTTFPAGSSEAPAITPDGRYVCFYSTATNLVGGVRTTGDIYVRDLSAGTTFWASAASRAASLASLGSTNIVCYNHAISEDGRYVAYQASVAFTGFTNSLVLRYDSLSASSEVISSNAFYGSAVYEDLRSLDMSPDGRVVAFIARPGPVGIVNTSVLVWNDDTGQTTLASGGLDGTIPANSVADSPMLDRNGRYVAFACDGTNLVAGSVSAGFHLYLRDLQAGITTLLDDTNGTGGAISPATFARLSGDGRVAAFESTDGSLVANDNNRGYDVFVRDLSSGAVEFISARDPSLPSFAPNDSSTLSRGSLSSDGRFVGFASAADNLVTGDTNGLRDVFMRDTLTGTNILVSANTNGLSGNGVSMEPGLSADGRYIVFTSSAEDLVPGDTNRTQDVFIRDVQAGRSALVSVDTNGIGPGNKESYSPTLSADGRYVLFRSKASNLASGIFSATENLFLRDLQLQTTYPLTRTGLVSMATTPDLRFVAFTDLRGSGTLYLWDSRQVSIVYTNGGVGISVDALSQDGNRLIFRAGSGSYSLYAAERDPDTNSAQVIAFGTTPGTRPAPKFSSDGRFLAYCWNPGGTNLDQVYLYDFQTGTNLLVSRDYTGTAAGNGGSDSPDLSADGRFIAYRSAATNIVSGDANGVPDIMIYDRVLGVTFLVSASRLGDRTADNRALTPLFSADGKTLFFESWASDITDHCYNHSANIFVFDFSSSALPVFLMRLMPGTTQQSALIVWPIIPGKTYRVQYKDNLSEPDWKDLLNQPTFIGAQAQLEDVIPGVPQRFYRVVAF